MKIPLQISYRNTDPSEAVTHAIEERASRLEKYSDRITSCRVMVEAPHRNHRKGNNYRVRVDLTVPGAELVVGRDRSHDGDHEDVYLSIRDAFLAAERQVRDWSAMVRGDVKTHANEDFVPSPAQEIPPIAS